MKYISGIISLFILVVVLAFAACELPGSTASLRILLPGASGSRAVITSDSVQRLLTYEIKLSSAGRQTVTREAGYGQSIEIILEPGTWTVELNAYFRKHKNGDDIANFPTPQEVLLAPGKIATVDVAMQVNEWLLGVELIANVEEFKKIGMPLSDGGWFGEEKNYLLLTDLTLDNWVGFQIWGTITGRAVFDGGGHTITIKSFNPNRPDGIAQNYGLFVDAFNANIKNLTVKLEIGATNSIQNVVIAGGVTAIGSNVDMENVHVSGTLNVGLDTTFPNALVGGIAGEISNGTIDQCSSTLAITTLQPSSGGNDINIGGLAGKTTNVDIVSSFSNGTMTVESTTGLVQAGGIVGLAQANGTSENIRNCYSAGNITVNGGTCYTGGIVGAVDGTPPDGITVMSSYSSAIIVSNSTSASSTGGIAGVLPATPIIPAIRDCFALNPSITTTGGTAVKRIVGIATGTAGELAGNYALAGMEIDSVPVNGTNGADENGADFPLSDPPTESELNPLLNLGFVMPKGSDYRYPVLDWQNPPDEEQP